jgi:hypothetical protein
MFKVCEENVFAIKNLFKFKTLYFACFFTNLIFFVGMGMPHLALQFVSTF